VFRGSLGYIVKTLSQKKKKKKRHRDFIPTFIMFMARYRGELQNILSMCRNIYLEPEAVAYTCSPTQEAEIR
jgi:hypothetical protein